ncbi:MAG: nickel pincer cofactor biosynthesis protein LarC [Proteobacteria bacterium]|nr:nickel pincer cofactor biosynthesis protein LarC [Pseudomonadota bacterium]MBU1742390.1 nickel pincer cofactor biosynthesis protein LarC [Pseudomonadota bacterium]
MNLLYLDVFAGLSGDMFLAALIDAGADVDVVRDAVRALGLGGVEVLTSRDTRGGIAGTRVEIKYAAGVEGHRHWDDIRRLIEDSSLGEAVKTRAVSIFFRLAEAEAAVHGVEVERVHFHEVGAVDSIVDIVGAAALVEALGDLEVTCSPLPLGRGFVDTAHGRLPLPAPATARLLQGAPVIGDPAPVELVTPTGAALAVVLSNGFGPLPEMTIDRVGHGLGSRRLEDRPNLLRVFRGRRPEGAPGLGVETVALLSTRIDDQTPELLAAAAESLVLAGALDVALTPLMMKKGRPGVEISVMARVEDGPRLAEMLLVETGSLGVRHQEVRRWVLWREVETVETEYGPVRIKVGRPAGERPMVAPEYDDVRRLAEARGVPARVIYEAALVAALIKNRG